MISPGYKHMEVLAKSERSEELGADTLFGARGGPQQGVGEEKNGYGWPFFDYFSPRA